MNTDIFERSIQKDIESWMFKKKVLILYGARQVGKTTLSKKLVAKFDGFYLNAERESVKTLLQKKNIKLFLQSIEEKKFVVIDEAQKIKGIGEILKFFIDEIPEIQILATGSSSFDLANETAEPLTGRKISFTLYPLSVAEMKISPLSFSEEISDLLLYGSYPDIYSTESQLKKRLKLDELASDYLYKDVLEFERLKKSDLLMKILKALALQLGSEVSYQELSSLLQTSKETIIRYITLLEKSFVIFRLPSLHRNMRNELAKKQKIFFYDLGIRNSLLQSFSPLELRVDKGALWENFCIVERLKWNQANQSTPVNYYFWRTYQKKEIDLIEERDGKMTAFEFKWNPRKKVSAPKDFMRGYENSAFTVISPENFLEYGLE